MTRILALLTLGVMCFFCGYLSYGYMFSSGYGLHPMAAFMAIVATSILCCIIIKEDESL